MYVLVIVRKTADSVSSDAIAFDDLLHAKMRYYAELSQFIGNGLTELTCTIYGEHGMGVATEHLETE